MTARILDGNAIAASIRRDIASRVAEREAAGKRPPGLAVLLVGDDPGSQIYVRLKRRDCEEIGFKSDIRHLSANTPQDRLIAMVRGLNADPTIDGILVQLPLPRQIDALAVMEEVSPAKDVDGVHPHNMGRLALREPTLRPCTSLAVMTLVEHTGVVLRGLDATVIGASNHVGRPMGLELLLAGCTVTTVHRFSHGTAEHAARSDLVVSATGKAGLVGADWVKPGAIVIDVGIIAQPDGRLRGDVRFDEVRERAGWLTPVPGGVGPVTRAAMLQNALRSAERASPLERRGGE